MDQLPETGLSAGQVDVAVQADNLVKRFGALEALSSVSVSIKKGEFFSLLGPSGCGKTTLLRIIAGLESPDGGKLSIGGVYAASIPAHRRPVNTVFQSYALFPHMTVSENISFGLRMKKISSGEIRRRVDEMMEIVQITPLAGRMPDQLSGGQRQRVALARALVNEPEVLLLDEPLGALDLKLRKELQLELKRLQRRLGTTFVFVTHDQEEALVMSDRIAVMNSGRIEQLDSPAELYENPKTVFVAKFLGGCNIIEGTVRLRENLESGKALLETPEGEIVFSLRDDAGGMISGKKTVLGIRPEKIILSPTINPQSENSFHGIVEEVVYNGAETQYRIRIGNLCVQVCVMNSDENRFQCSKGQKTSVNIPARSIIVLN